MLRGAAAEFERDLPFSVWADALDAYVVSQELSLDTAWPPDLFVELGEILPSLRPPGIGARESLADERYRSHRAVRRLLEELAAERPLVLVLDDLHWSDGASIELIAALLRRGPDAPILFALAFRPGQAPERLAAALAVPTAQRIALPELSEADAARLLGALDVPSAIAHLPPRRRQPVLSGAARARPRARRARLGAAAATAAASRRRSPHRSPRSWPPCRRRSASCSRRRRSRASPSSRTSPPRSAGCRPATGSPRSTRCST